MKIGFAVALATLSPWIHALGEPSEPRAESHPFSVHDMLAMQRIIELAPSPDGRRVVFTLRTTDYEANRGRTDLWLLEADGQLRQLTTNAAGDSSAQWTPAGDEVLFLSSRSGSSQVWQLALAGGEARQLTKLPLDVNAFQQFPDGQRLALALEVYPDAASIEESVKRAAERDASKVKAMIYDELLFRHWDSWEDHKRSHIFVWDKRSDKALDLMQGWDCDSPTRPFGGSEEFAVAPDGQSVLFTAKHMGREAAWSTNLDLWLAPADASGAPRNLTDANEALDNLGCFSPDGKQLAYVAMARAGYEADRQGLVVLDLSSGNKRSLAADWDRSVAGLSWSSDGKSLIVDADDLGQHNLFAVDATSGAVQQLTRTGYNTGAVSTPQGLYFLRDDYANPAEIHQLAAGAEQARKRTAINDQRLAQARMGSFEQFTFAGANQETVHAWLVKPIDFDPGKRYPLVMMIHGGPQGSFGNHFHYRWNPQFLAGAGYASVMVDFHGSTGYGQAFSDAIRGDWGGAPYVDIMRGFEHALATYAFLDGDRAAAAGGSFGGYMVNWIQGQTTRFKALVAHSGNIDERMAYYDTEELWFPEWDHQGLPFDNEDNYTEHNPIEHVAQWQTPELVIHGGLDFRVVESQGMSTFTALQRKGVPSRFLYFPDENHWILKPQNSVLWHETFLDWIDRYCK